LRTRWTLVPGLVASLVLGQALAWAPSARAQCTPSATCVTVTATGKGVVGGGIIGAEIGFMIPALIVGAGVREMDEAWAYIIFPLVFGAGGAIGGYYAFEEANGGQGFPEAAVAVLAVGIALIVPTFVGVLALTSYTPGGDEGGGATSEEDARDDETGPPPEPSEERSALDRVLAGGPGLLRFDRGRLLLGVPMVHARPTYTSEEQEHMRLGGETDLNVPLVSGVF